MTSSNVARALLADYCAASQLIVDRRRGALCPRLRGPFASAPSGAAAVVLVDAMFVLPGAAAAAAFARPPQYGGAALRGRRLLGRQKKVWMSTSGLGVYWLHVRLDSRPKYYQFAEFANM